MTGSKFLFCETLVIPKKAFAFAEVIYTNSGNKINVRVHWRPCASETQFKDIIIFHLDNENNEIMTFTEAEKSAKKILRNIYQQLNE